MYPTPSDRGEVSEIKHYTPPQIIRLLTEQTRIRWPNHLLMLDGLVRLFPQSLPHDILNEAQELIATFYTTESL